MEKTSFKQAYEVLEKHAYTLRNNEEPNIDHLLDIVNESMQAYKVCKARIDAVEKALSQALKEENIPFDIDDKHEKNMNDTSGEDDIPF